MPSDHHHAHQTIDHTRHILSSSELNPSFNLRACETGTPTPSDSHRARSHLVPQTNAIMPVRPTAEELVLCWETEEKGTSG
jgi:hypothetical protein